MGDVSAHDATNQTVGDATWADLLTAIYDEYGEITPKVGAALARYKEAVEARP